MGQHVAHEVHAAAVAPAHGTVDAPCVVAERPRRGQRAGEGRDPVAASEVKKTPRDAGARLGGTMDLDIRPKRIRTNPTPSLFVWESSCQPFHLRARIIPFQTHTTRPRIRDAGRSRNIGLS